MQLCTGRNGGRTSAFFAVNAKASANSTQSQHSRSTLLYFRNCATAVMRARTFALPPRFPWYRQKSARFNNIPSTRILFLLKDLDIGQEIASTLVRQTRDKALREAQTAGIQWLVFDAAPGTACASREAMIKSDAVILVTEPTPFGLHDMSLAYQLAKASRKPCALVINKDSPGYAGIEKFANEEKVPIIARIPYNSRLAQSYSEGNIPVGAFPALEHALSRIASWLLKVRAGGQP